MPHHRSRARRLADGSVRVVDLTQPLSEKTPVLMLPEPFANTPGLTRARASAATTTRAGVGVERARVGEHVGTHFDAPIHWITGQDGEDVASVAARAARRPRRR